MEIITYIKATINKYPRSWRNFLGVLYFDYEDSTEPYIATNQGLASRKAIEATRILRHKYFDILFYEGFTYVFKICETEGELYLMDVFDKEGNRIKQGFKYDYKNIAGLRKKFPEV